MASRRDFLKLSGAGALATGANAGSATAGAFPAGFAWGCATSSYQVEGAAAEDGRKPSVWDTFAREPGRVESDHNGDVAVDHYHRYRQDVQLLKWLGVNAYRFSIAWPRIFPYGFGAPNEKGIQFYERLVDELLANGITPYATLFHWDLPQALEDRVGGWLSRDTAGYFADYAGYVAKRLSDRVTHFFTINEFSCFTDAGYAEGVFAPGKKLGSAQRNQVRHNGVLAHGRAVQALRAGARRPLQVALAENSEICVPVIETEPHIAAARKAIRDVNAHFLGVVLDGKYPDSYLTGPDAPKFPAEDLRVIASPLDFVGLNMYTPTYVRADDSAPGFARVPLPASYPRMASNWLAIGPQIAYWGPRLVREVWGVKDVYITENGCSAEDRQAADKQVYDTDRVMYVRNHLVQAQRAVAEGWPLRGYFLWSLMDNFEWTSGYTKRFGIFYVNFQTLERTPKLSAHFYREVIARGVVV